MPVNCDALENIESEPIQGTFYKLIRKRYADVPLSMFGALKEGGRYNMAGVFGALYLGFEQETCQAEVSQGIAAGLTFKKNAFVLWNYKVTLTSVVRLDNDSIGKKIGVTRSEIAIRGDHQWSSSIGAPLYDKGVEGLVAPSAQMREGRCLDIYLDNVKAYSSVEPLTQLGGWPQ